MHGTDAEKEFKHAVVMADVKAKGKGANCGNQREGLRSIGSSRRRWSQTVYMERVV
jgi:hypothetical protein